MQSQQRCATIVQCMESEDDAVRLVAAVADVHSREAPYPARDVRSVCSCDSVPDSGVLSLSPHALSGSHRRMDSRQGPDAYGGRIVLDSAARPGATGVTQEHVQ